MGNLYTKLKLHLFAEGGDGGGMAAGGGDAPAGDDTQTVQPQSTKGKARNPLADVQYGKQQDDGTTTVEPEQKAVVPDQERRKADFETLIKGEYKDLFDGRVQSIIDQRFKTAKQNEARLADYQKLDPVMEMLASKYGVDGKDIDALTKAIQDDDSYYEAEADERGLSVQQLKQIKQLEAENAKFRQAQQEIERRQNADRIYADWMQQAEGLKAFYPNFDFRAEIAPDNPTAEQFMGLLRNNVDVKTAYEVVHHNEILGGAMQYTAQQVAQKVTNDIRARGQRPQANGASGSAAVTVKSDPKKFTKADRDEIERRALRGERIIL